MQFTPQEQKMITWLRQQHAGWRTTRAITLTSAILCLGFAVLEFSRSGFEAMPLLLLLISVYGASHTLGSWSGRPEISLLLKLVEAQQAEQPIQSLTATVQSHHGAASD